MTPEEFRLVLAAKKAQIEAKAAAKAARAAEVVGTKQEANEKLAGFMGCLLNPPKDVSATQLAEWETQAIYWAKEVATRA